MASSSAHPGPLGDAVRTGNKKRGVWRQSKTVENMPAEGNQYVIRPVQREVLRRQQNDGTGVYALLTHAGNRRSRRDELYRARMAEALRRDSEFNPNARDTTGNSPLLLAVKNDNPEVVDQQLNRATRALVKEALLLSISLDHHHISESIIRHPTYSATRSDDEAHGTLTSEVSETSLDVTADDTLFAADITPLVLAAQRNQYDVVKLLISRGESIEEPHTYSCKCKDCRGAQTFDELRFAKTRLNVFRGLASVAYISLSSPDPFLAAFRLARIFKRNSQIEKYYRGEYKMLIKQLGDYTVKLLDKVRDGEELDIVLNESRGTPFSDLSKMARLKLAIRYEGKLFVAHASCQKKITDNWYGGLASMQQWSYLAKVFWVFGFTLIYPLMALMYWVYPFGKLGKFLSTPVVKFMADALSHVSLVVLVLLYSVNEYASDGNKLSTEDEISTKYKQYLENCQDSGKQPAIEDVFIRSNQFGLTAYVLGLFVAGYVWQILKSLSLEKLHFLTDNWFNVMDVIMFGLYVASFFLRFLTVRKVNQAIDHFSKTKNWDALLESNGSNDNGHLYWLDADRHSWREWDPFIVSEAMFAVANIMCITRTASMLTASTIIGPLIIALREMIKNVLIFMGIFLIVIIAFMVGFNSLYWYYDIAARRKAERVLHERTNAEENFGKVIYIMRTIYFALFGMIDADAVEVGQGYKDYVTTNVGYLMLGAYNWISIIVLINMLIAMMARSYLYIEADKDVEWKYSRTKLYLEYIKEGNVLCVPFNLVPSLWGLIELVKDIGTCCGCRNPSDDARKKSVKEKQKQQVKFMNKAYEDEDGEAGSSKPTPDESTHTPKAEGETHRDSAAEKPDKNTLPDHYKKVIEKIIKRFIMHTSTKKQASSGAADDSNSVLAVIKRDMSNFRYEVMKTLKSHDGDDSGMQETVASFEARLKETNKHVEEVATTCLSLEQNLLGEVRENLSETNQKLSAMEERARYAREDAHNYEANIGLRLKNMEGNFSSEMTKFQSLASTLNGIESSLRHLASEVKELKSNMATVSSALANGDQKVHKSVSFSDEETVHGE